MLGLLAFAILAVGPERVRTTAMLFAALSETSASIARAYIAPMRQASISNGTQNPTCRDAQASTAAGHNYRP
jgi:hypothetical protein